MKKIKKARKSSLGKVCSDENGETVYVKQFHFNKGFCHIGLYSWPDVVNKFKQFFQPWWILWGKKRGSSHRESASSLIRFDNKRTVAYIFCNSKRLIPLLKRIFEPGQGLMALWLEILFLKYYIEVFALFLTSGESPEFMYYHIKENTNERYENKLWSSLFVVPTWVKKAVKLLLYCFPVLASLQSTSSLLVSWPSHYRDNRLSL